MGNLGADDDRGPPASSPAEASPETRAHHRQAVEKAVEAMHRNLGREFTLRDMAAEVYISPYHFHRIFRHAIGIPPAYFLSALRFQSAKRLLVETDEKIIDVCFEVGFSSVGTFSRRFKELVGVSPKDLRKAVVRRRRRLVLPPRNELPLAGHRAPIELTGRVVAPQGFEGKVFVGLFDSPLPQGPPASCCVLPRPGTFHLSPVPDGLYYALAAGYKSRLEPPALVLGEATLRGGSIRHPIRVRGGRWMGSSTIALRRPEVTDPPILVALPLLLHAMRKRREVRRLR